MACLNLRALPPPSSSRDLADDRIRPSRSHYSPRNTSSQSDGAARPFSFPHLHWRESIDSAALCRARRHSLFLPIEPDPDTTLLTHGRRRCSSSATHDHFCLVALVRLVS